MLLLVFYSENCRDVMLVFQCLTSCLHCAELGWIDVPCSNIRQKLKPGVSATERSRLLELQRRRYAAVVDQTRWEHGPNTYLVEFRGCLFVFLIHPWKVAIFNKIHLKRNTILFQIINTDVFGFPLQFGKNSLMYLFPSDPHLVKPLLPETSNDCGVIKHESLIWTD